MRSLLIGASALVAFVATSAGCARRTNDCNCSGDASTTSAEMRGPAPAATAPPAAAGQVVVVVPPAAATESPPAAAPPTAAPPPPAAEQPTPDWVPDAGRLSIIHTPDLARNLGLITESPRDAGAAPASP